jgi:hypothetical protein
MIWMIADLTRHSITAPVLNGHMRRWSVIRERICQQAKHPTALKANTFHHRHLAAFCIALKSSYCVVSLCLPGSLECFSVIMWNFSHTQKLHCIWSIETWVVISKFSIFLIKWCNYCVRAYLPNYPLNWKEFWHVLVYSLKTLLFNVCYIFLWMKRKKTSHYFFLVNWNGVFMILLLTKRIKIG